MNGALLLFLSLSLSGSVLALAALLLGALVRGKLSQTWQYYIWLVVILRFLLPFSPEESLVGVIAERLRSPASEESVTAPDMGIIAEVPAGVFPPPAATPQYGEPAAEPAGEASPHPMWLLWSNLGLFWLMIALASFAHKAASYRSFVRFVRLGSEPVTDEHMLELYREELAGAGIRRELPILRNNQVVSPMLIGILRPALILPDMAVSDGELRSILRHELTHHKRHDFLYKWLVQITLCLHWFNPLLYMVAKRINRSCELSCDEAVIRRLDEAGRVTYGDALVASLSAQGNYSDFVVTMSMSESGKHVKERLDAIMSYRKKSALTAIVAAGLTALLLTGFAFAGAYRSPDAETQPVSERGSDRRMFEEVKLTVKNCNVIVRVSEDGEPRYEYDPKQYEVIYDYKPSPGRDSLHAAISVEKIGGGFASYENMAVIYLPEKSFDDFTVEGYGAGVSLPELDANLHLTNDGGSMSAQLPEGFSKTIDFASKNGSGCLVIHEEAKDYLLSIQSDGSAVSVPPEFPAFTPNRLWEHRNGNGAAKISLDLKGSSFAVTLDLPEKRAAEEASADKPAPAFIRPVEGGNISTYEGHTGNGVDFVGDLKDAPVYAAASGTVVTAHEGWTGYGHYIVIDHGDGYRTLYAHNSELFVEPGDEVKQGERIALVGRTGNATGHQLHFEIERNGEYLHPEEHLGSIAPKSHDGSHTETFIEQPIYQPHEGSIEYEEHEGNPIEYEEHEGNPIDYAEHGRLLGAEDVQEATYKAYTLDGVVELNAFGIFATDRGLMKETLPESWVARCDEKLGAYTLTTETENGCLTYVYYNGGGRYPWNISEDGDTITIDIMSRHRTASDGYTLLYFTAPKEFAGISVLLDGESF